MHRLEGYEFPEVRMRKLALSEKPDWRPMGFKGVFALDNGLHVPGVGFRLSILANCFFADRILSEYGVRDIIEKGPGAERLH